MKEIQLTKGKVALVDDEDYDKLSNYKWFSHKGYSTYYAFRNSSAKGGKKRTFILMHREILGLTNPTVLCDHKDHNGLNNQRWNLRSATKSENNSNRRPTENRTSKYLGVSWNRKKNKWVAQITSNRKKIWIGACENECEAALAYNEKAIELHGQFAKLNHVA